MQGIESLDNFKNFVSSLGGLGRYEDTYIVHLAEGETVVPMEVLDKNPVLKKRLFKTMRDMGIEPERYIVGNELNSINPVTGQPEFFLKKIFRRLRKAKQDDSEQFLESLGLQHVSGYAALAGAVGSGTEGAFWWTNLDLEIRVILIKHCRWHLLGGSFGGKGSQKDRDVGGGEIFEQAGLQQFIKGKEIGFNPY